MATRGTVIRAVRETVLAVGEGYAEETFLKHLRALYTSKTGGRHVTVWNARGRGSAHVITEAGRIASRRPHSYVASLFDADTDFNDDAAENARKKKIVPVSCDPCIEAVLLRMHGDITQRDSTGHKQAFAQRFGLPAHDARVYGTHFPRDFLDAARVECSRLDALLRILGQ